MIATVTLDPSSHALLGMDSSQVMGKKGCILNFERLGVLSMRENWDMKIGGERVVGQGWKSNEEERNVMKDTRE